MKKLCIAIFCAAGILSAADRTAPLLTLKTDRADAVYAAEEKVGFQILFRNRNSVPPERKIRCAVFFNGTRVETKEFAAKELPETLSAVGKEPGFFLLQLRVELKGGEKEFLRGAAVSPEKIQPTQVMPEDFDSFWKSVRDQVSSVPMNVKKTPVKSVIDKIALFDVEVGCSGGMPVRGYLAIPKDASRKYPLCITYDSAGVRSANPKALGDGNMIVFGVNAHGIANGMPDEFYRNLHSGALKDYMFRNWDDRRKTYFYGMYQRIIRAQQFVKTLPEWDGRNLLVRGASQGGAQAIAAAYLDPAVTVVAAHVPALCDLSGPLHGRHGGWPYPNVKKSDAVALTAGYYDTVNFARKIRPQTVCLLMAGFQDPVCPPVTVYAAYNSLNVKNKKMINGIDGGHGFNVHGADWKFILDNWKRHPGAAEADSKTKIWEKQAEEPKASAVPPVLPAKNLSVANIGFQAGTPRKIPSHIMGFGRELIYRINKPHLPVHQPDEMSLLREIGAQALRGPAGTPSNYYLWKTGFMYSSDEFADAVKRHHPGSDSGKRRIAPDQGTNSKTPRPVTLKDVYAQAAELDIPYTFCVNVVNETPESIVELVGAIGKLSRQPISLEMGNELYEPGKSFKDAGEYVKKVRRIYKAVKTAAPDVKIGVVSPAFPAPDDRMNASMLRTLAERGNRGCSRYVGWPQILSENRDAFDAVILHPYLTVQTDGFNFTQDSLMAYFFALNACMQERLDYEIKRFFPGKELWITEYNILPWITFGLRPQELRNRFQFGKTPGAAVVNLETMLRFIDQGHVTEAFLHTFNDTQCFGAVQPDWTQKGKLVRLPNFHAFKQLGKTLREHQYYYPLTAPDVRQCNFLLNLHHVSQGPERIFARYDAVGAWGFGNGNRLKTVYYVNRTGKPQKVFLTGKLLRKTWCYGGEEPFPEFLAYSRHWTSPPAILPEPEILEENPVKELILKPFSMTVADVSEQ